MTWEAKFPPSDKAGEWISGSDLTVLPRPNALTDEERADFVQGREAWIEAAERFVMHHNAPVGGRIIGYRIPKPGLGTPPAFVSMEFHLWGAVGSPQEATGE